MVEFFKNYFFQFSQGINQGYAYYSINLIPEIRIFGQPDRVWLYLFILRGLAVILTFTGFQLFYYQRKINFVKIFFYFILILWLISSVGWFLIQGQWLKDDLANFKGRSLAERRSIILSKVIAQAGLPNTWHDFYDFLEFARQEIPNGSVVDVIPKGTYNTFSLWAKYWLYPDLQLAEPSQSADYILLFNIDLPEKIDGFEKFKQFAPNKLILKPTSPFNPRIR